MPSNKKKLPSYYRCSLCLMVMSDPVKLRCCGDRQCKECALHRLTLTRNKCWRNCGTRLRTETDLISLDYISQRIRQLRIKKRRKTLYCYVCKTKGHRTSRCPTITCIKCHEVGHAEIDCPKNRDDIESKFDVKND